MLSFFRKYQRFFFLIITVVIVISFSLFGTYNTLMKETSFHEQVAFTAVDGKAISRTDLDQMANFLATDSFDKLNFGGAWGPNFLNDGVITNDFLSTGLGQMLAQSYGQEISTDLQTKLEREKRYVPYAHPTANFISADTAWSYFAPNIKSGLQELKEAPKAESPEAFGNRINLYMAERQFPSSMLRQVLHYQERQYGWVAPDQNLDRTDLSLFGYHTAEDWFGPRFIRLVSEFVINAAKVAEQRGYKVSKEEALVDLLHNADISFQQTQKSGQLGLKSAGEYFNEQLRRMTMDQQQAVKLWRQVLLFRRLFNDVGNTVYVDPASYQKFEDYAKETVNGELYFLPKPLHLANYQDLQKFEVYLEAVSKRGNDPLALPKAFLAVQEVEKQNPELVQRRFLLEISAFDKKSLQAKVSIKDTWKWETEEKNWEILKKQFPELGIKKAHTSDERFAALEALDDKTRQKIDAFARAAIVDSHPEWLTNGLDQAKSKQMAVAIHLKWGKTPFAGLEKNEELIALLDSDTAKAQERLNFYTADNNSYYRIKVIERVPNKEILSFAEANEDGTLDKLLKKKLEADYLSIREARPLEFQKADKSWKSLDEVQDLVATHYFEKVLKAIRDSNKEVTSGINGDFYAQNRLYNYVSDVKAKIQSAPEQAPSLLQTPKATEEANKLASRVDLKEQWKLESEAYRLARSESSKRDAIKPADLFALQADEWSKVYTTPKGNIVFFHMQEKKSGSTGADVAAKVGQIQELAGDEAQRHLMANLLELLKKKNAISLEYMNPGQ